MKRGGSWIIHLVLAAFLLSSFSSVRLSKTEIDSNSLSGSIEDVQDTTDVEDELEDNDDFKEKGSTQAETLTVTKHVALTLAHQHEIFSSHHPTVITPPPRG